MPIIKIDFIKIFLLKNIAKKLSDINFFRGLHYMSDFLFICKRHGERQTAHTSQIHQQYDNKPRGRIQLGGKSRRHSHGANGGKYF